jgi:hypothetical protein
MEIRNNNHNKYKGSTTEFNSDFIELVAVQMVLYQLVTAVVRPWVLLFGQESSNR